MRFFIAKEKENRRGVENMRKVNVDKERRTK